MNYFVLSLSNFCTHTLCVPCAGVSTVTTHDMCLFLVHAGVAINVYSSHLLQAAQAATSRWACRTVVVYHVVTLIAVAVMTASSCWT